MNRKSVEYTVVLFTIHPIGAGFSFQPYRSVSAQSLRVVP